MRGRLTAWWRTRLAAQAHRPLMLDHGMTPDEAGRAKLKTCRNCKQRTLVVVPVTTAGNRLVDVYMCGTCDSAHCPRCRAYCGPGSRFCTECGASLSLRGTDLTI